MSNKPDRVSAESKSTKPAKPQRFQPLALVQRIEGGGDEGRALYLCDRNAIYPVVLAAIAAGVKATPHSGDEDEERYDDEGEADARHWNAQLARRSPALAQAIADAGRAPDAIQCTSAELPARRQARARVLELARCWFTNELHRAAWAKHGDAGLHVRWTEERPTNNAGEKLPSPWRL